MIASRGLTTKQLQQIEEELLAERARVERSMEIQRASDGGMTATGGVATRAPATEEPRAA